METLEQVSPIVVSLAPGAAGWRQGVVLLVLATRNVGAGCSGSHAGSPR